MNLAGMGAAGMDRDHTNAQISSSGDHESGNTDSNKYNAQAGPGPGSLATNAGLITQMANI
jgi:hypothetical protein